VRPFFPLHDEIKDTADAAGHALGRLPTQSLAGYCRAHPAQASAATAHTSRPSAVLAAGGSPAPIDVRDGS